MPDWLEPGVFRSVMEQLQVGIYFTDKARRIVFWNTGAERITGYLGHEVLGRCCRDNILLHCDQKQVVVCTNCCPLVECMADGKAREASLFLRHKSGHRIPIRIHTLPIRDREGAIVGAAECFQRQRYVPHPERREPSNFYRIDEIPDYAFMLSELRLRLARMNEGGPGFGVLCLAVDRFEEVRVNRGREACESILQVIAKTLQNTIRPGDCLGGWADGTLLLLVGSTAPEGLFRAGERLRALVGCSSVVWWGDPIGISASIGVTVARVGDCIETLLERLDQALDASRNHGGNRVTVLNT